MNPTVPLTAATGYNKTRQQRRTEGEEEEEGGGGGGARRGCVSCTYRVKGTTPAAADWTKLPQMTPPLSDPQGVWLGARLAQGDIGSNSLPLPVFCHCNPSEYTSSSCLARKCLDDASKPVTTQCSWGSLLPLVNQCTVTTPTPSPHYVPSSPASSSGTTDWSQVLEVVEGEEKWAESLSISKHLEGFCSRLHQQETNPRKGIKKKISQNPLQQLVGPPSLLMHCGRCLL